MTPQERIREMDRECTCEDCNICVEHYQNELSRTREALKVCMNGLEEISNKSGRYFRFGIAARETLNQAQSLLSANQDGGRE